MPEKKSETRKKIVQIKVPDGVHRALRIEALRRGITLARVINEVLHRHTQQEGSDG